jgi:hypothetical protein
LHRGTEEGVVRQKQKLRRFRIAFAWHGRESREGAMIAPLGCQSEDACERWFVANYVKPMGSRYELLCAYEVQ